MECGDSSTLCPGSSAEGDGLDETRLTPESSAFRALTCHHTGVPTMSAGVISPHRGAVLEISLGFAALFAAHPRCPGLYQEEAP